MPKVPRDCPVEASKLSTLPEKKIGLCGGTLRTTFQSDGKFATFECAGEVRRECEEEGGSNSKQDKINSI